MNLTDGLRLAVPSIDREHADMIQAAAELQTLMNSSLPDARRLATLLDGFIELAAGHFASEEELMQSSGYQGCRAHAAEHKRLFEQLKEVKAGLATSAIDPSAALGLFMEVWTTQHIQRLDRHLAEYLKSQEP